MDIFTLVAEGAFLAGLVFFISVWYIHMLRRSIVASEAEEGAASASASRTLLDKLQVAAKRTEQLLDLVAHDRYLKAQSRASDLESQMWEIPFRISPFLSDEGKNQLLNIREQAGIVSRTLSNSIAGGGLSLNQKRRVMAQCEEMALVLRENLGTIEARRYTNVFK